MLVINSLSVLKQRSVYDNKSLKVGTNRMKRLHHHEIKEAIPVFPIAVLITTAIRWIEYLDEQGLVLGLPHAHDRRTIQLSAKGRSAMDDYLRQVRDATVIGPLTRQG